MGLFDRIKKAFQHNKKNNDQSTNESNSEIESIESDSENIDQISNESEAKETSTEVEDTPREESVEEYSESEVKKTSTEVEDTSHEESVEEYSKPEIKETSTEVEDTSREESVEEYSEPEIKETSIEVEDTPREESVKEYSEPEIKETSIEVEDTPREESVEEYSEPKIKEISTESEDTSSEDEENLIQDNPNNSKYDKGLEKTRKTFGEKLNELFARFRTVDEDFFDELEETLILSDVGLDTSVQLTEDLRQEVRLKNVKKTKDIQNTIIEKLVSIYEQNDTGNQKLHLANEGLSVVLFVGVNGAGKTTTIGKMANQFKSQGKKVVLAAADTFRAGAINQLVKWGERSGVPVVAGSEGSDPASVVYDAVQEAKNNQSDILLVDTAGRLQNKDNLMRELNKIKRVIQKEIPEAPHEVLLVIDATTGQNALIQAKKFNETTDVTGLVLTKLDGTAKGGIILAIKKELNIPVKFVGLGEKINDLAPFDSEQFIYGLFKDLWIEN